MTNNDQIELFLTNELINFESEKFCEQNIVARSNYQKFYSSFSKLRNVLVKSEVITHLINIIQNNKESFTADINVYALLYRNIQRSSWLNSYSNVIKIHDFDRIPKATNTAYIYKKTSSTGNDSVFGTYSLIENVDLHILSKVRSLAEVIVPRSMETFLILSPSDPSLKIPIQSLLSLTGESIFLGLYYKFVDCFDFRIDFLMAIVRDGGLTTSTLIFYDVITRHLRLMSDSLGVVILEIMVPNVSIFVEKSKAKSTTVKETVTFEGCSLWTYKDWIKDEQKTREVVAKLAALYLNNDAQLESLPFIKLHAMVSRDNNNSIQDSVETYQKVSITYVLHTLEIKEQMNEKEKWSNFENRENKFIHHLFSSLFFNQSSAEALMTLVLHQSLKRPYPSIPLIVKDKDDVQRKEIKSVFGIFKFPEDNSLKEVTQTKEDNNKEIWKEKLIISEKFWVEKIVKSDKILDFSIILENVINLLSIRSSFISSYVDQKLLKDEVHLILESSIFKLNHVIGSNVTLRQVIYCFNEHQKDKFVLKLFFQYFQELKHVFDNMRRFEEYDTFVRVLSEKILNRIKKFFVEEDSEVQIKEITKPQMMLELRYYNNLCYPLLWQMIGDSFHKCLNLEKLLLCLDNQFPSLINKVEVQITEDEFKNEFDFILFSNQTEKKKSESNILEVVEYLQEIKFNRCWKEFLVKMLPEDGEDHLSNPHSLLADLFNIYSITFNFEYLKNIPKDNLSFQYESQDGIIYKVNDCEAYGLKSAITLFDSAVFKRLESIFLSLNNTNYEKKLGLFEIVISTGFSGHFLSHGKINPMMKMLDVVDNVYIQGPDNCLEEGSQIFAKTVLKHILDIESSMLTNNSLMLGLYLPEINQVWSMSEIKKNHIEIMIQMGRIVRNMGTIHIKIMVPYEWRYLTVVKYFQFHYLNFQKTQYFSSVNSSNRIIEPFGLIFLNQESSQIYLKNGGYLKVTYDPLSSTNLTKVEKQMNEIITKNYQNQKWINLYHTLITQSLLKENYDFINEVTLLLHGTLVHLDYLNFINKTIQSVIYHVIQSNNFSLETPVVDDSLQVKSTSKNTKGTNVVAKTSTSDIIQSSFRGYYALLMKVFQNQSLEHLHFKDLILSLINKITKENDQKKVSIVLDDNSIVKLEQLREIVESVECFYGQSSRRCCPKSLEYIQSLCTKKEGVQETLTETVAEENYKNNLTLKMIKEDVYKQWVTTPNYEDFFHK